MDSDSKVPAVMDIGDEPEEQDETVVAAQNWRAAIAHTETERNRGTKWFWLLVTLALFVSFRGTENIVSTLTGLVPVILFHELGHVVAMRICGYRDVSIFFIPLLGAAARGREVNASQTKRAFVALMGPLPGILLALVLMIFTPWTSYDLLQSVVELLLILNVFNLLPVKPLDGGRLFEAVLMSRSIAATVFFSLISPVVLGLLALAGPDIVLLVFAGFMFVGSLFDIKVSRLTGSLRKEGLQVFSPSAEDLPDDRLMAIIHRIRERFSGITDQNLANIAKLAIERLSTPKSSAGATVGMIALYGVALLIGVLGFMAASYLSVQDDPVYQGKPISEWVYQLEAGSETERHQAEVTLDALFHSEEVAVQDGALKTIGVMGADGSVAVPILAKRLVEELEAPKAPAGEPGNVMLMQAITKTMGELGPVAVMAYEELPNILAGALSHREWPVRLEAAVALGKLGPAAGAALPALADAMKKEEEALVKESMSHALAELTVQK